MAISSGYIKFFIHVDVNWYSLPTEIEKNAKNSLKFESFLIVDEFTH